MVEYQAGATLNNDPLRGFTSTADGPDFSETTRDGMADPIINVQLEIGKIAGPFYHLQKNKDGAWPSKPICRNYGAFAADKKPNSILQMVEWCALGNSYLNEPCTLYTFYIHGGQNVAFTQSKVRGGTTPEINQIVMNSTILDNCKRFIIGSCEPISLGT